MFRYFLFLFLFFILPSQVFAKNLLGYDISYPQCNSVYPTHPHTFGIIGVSDGKAFTQNPCLLDEFFFAKRQKTQVSVYMNLNYPSGKTIQYGMSGPAGKCSVFSEKCHAYNYGYEAAEAAYYYAQSQLITAKTWWIDIELANTWADSTYFNNILLQGTLDFFTQKNIQVGIYSTKRDWNNIMGSNFQPMQQFIYPVLNWVGGAKESNVHTYCIQPFSVNSPVQFVQYVKNDLDIDFSCWK